MRLARKYTHRPRMIPTIPEGEVFARVLAAIKALRAMPDAERRFLMAGTKSGWVQTLVEWADLVAQADQVQDDVAPRDTYRPTRRDISDAMIAGAWFAKLALLPENADEFEAKLEAYRLGKRKSPRVDDQRILSWWAFGWSLKLIGEGTRTNEQQAERRLAEISSSLWRIANGRARLADIDARKRARKSDQARHASGGTAG